MERATFRALVLATVAAGALAGCVKAVDGTTEPAPAGTETAAVTRGETSVRLVDRDVEAPQVFQVSDSALWDGRPSLGGVWVASPDAVDPERVILRNPSNGKFVIGALFRRERLNPGPALQISSDAAAALGILAGQPTEMNVTALRREEAGAAPAPDATKPILDANEAVDTTALASASAAIDRADGKGAAPAPVSGRVTATAALPAAPSAEATAATEPAPKPARRGWFFGKRKPAEPVAETAALEGADAGGKTATGKTPAGAITSGPITSGPIADASKTVTEAEKAPIAVVAQAPSRPAAAKPAAKGAMIQIGIFSVQTNADRAVKLLSSKGVSARKLTETSQGKTFWRVVTDAGNRTATLASVKAAGFADAYPVSR